MHERVPLVSDGRQKKADEKQEKSSTCSCERLRARPTASFYFFFIFARFSFLPEGMLKNETWEKRISHTLST